MTISSPSATTAPTNARQDPRPALQHAVGVAAAVIAAVPPTALDARTPCPDFTVRALLGHLVGGLDRIAGAGRGLDVSVLKDVSDVHDDGWIAAWAAGSADAADAWADPRRLAMPAVLPFATLPGAAAVALYTAEILTHAWDLARATGAELDPDETVVEGALAAARFGLPEQPRGGAIPFAPVVPTPADAPALDRLVAWQGRDPSWSRT